MTANLDGYGQPQENRGKNGMQILAPNIQWHHHPQPLTDDVNLDADCDVRQIIESSDFFDSTKMTPQFLVLVFCHNNLGVRIFMITFFRAIVRPMIPLLGMNNRYP